MFIEARRSAWRTPAGCYVGHSPRIVRGLIRHIAPRWGAALARTTLLQTLHPYGVPPPTEFGVIPSWFSDALSHWDFVRPQMHLLTFASILIQEPCQANLLRSWRRQHQSIPDTSHPSLWE